MTKKDFAKHILSTVDNRREEGANDSIILEDIEGLLFTVEPKNRERFAQWGYPNELSTTEDCWK